MELGRLGVWYCTDGVAASTTVEWAKRIESLGYSAFWIPESVGRDPFAHAAWLLAHTDKLIVATGIANIYHRIAGCTVQAQQTLAEQSGDRFLLGLGVSHKPMIKGIRKLKYRKPLKKMRKYLEKMDQAPYKAPAPATPPPRILAALGPKMLELARELSAGAHPYFTSPQHTKTARKILGPDKWLCVEQKVILAENPEIARNLARAAIRMCIDLPNYRNNWFRMGLNKDDLQKGGSDRFIDATFAWGDIRKIRARIDEHFAAGASHVCVQPMVPNDPDGGLPIPLLEELAKTLS